MLLTCGNARFLPSVRTAFEIIETPQQTYSQNIEYLHVNLSCFQSIEINVLISLERVKPMHVSRNPFFIFLDFVSKNALCDSPFDYVSDSQLQAAAWWSFDSLSIGVSSIRYDKANIELILISRIVQVIRFDFLK